MADNTLRSQSRGREAIASTGRGGVGNIRSVSRDALKGVHGEHEDDASNTRGREFNVSPKVKSSGRGGVGNIRSSSTTRSPSAGPNLGEKEIIKQHIAESEGVPHSSGRGGSGNITGSRSRSRGPAGAGTTVLPPLHSSGRGGAGNITREGFDQNKLAKVEAAEMLKHAPTIDEAHMHSTGRGGLANITNLPEPLDAKDAPHLESASPGPHVHSSGRGGAGNIHAHRTAGADGDEHERGREPQGTKNVLAQVWDKVRAASSSRSRTDAHAQAVATTGALTRTGTGTSAGTVGVNGDGK